VDPPPPKLDTCLAKARELLDRVGETATVDRLELFCRVTASARVSVSATGMERSVAVGIERGLAVRVWADASAPRFAAVSGSDEAAARRAVALAMRAPPCGPDSTAAPPGPSEGAPLLDEDPAYGPPRVGDLEDWLDAAAGRVRWIESASTVECVVSTGSVAAARSRSRVWSLNGPRSLAASRGLRLPLPLRSSSDSEESSFVETGVLDAGARRLPWLVRPEPAALLVQALVRHFHRPGSRAVEVGPAWRVADDPTDPRALFGGRFDDTGFPSGRVVLADGGRWLSGLAVRGHLRRASFRDPPVPMPSHLVVSDGDDPEPPDALVVTALRIHPLGDRWFLELEGRVQWRGSHGGGFRGLVVAARPDSLPRRCVGSVGPARLSHRGVVTPSLVFEGSEDAAVR